MRYVCVLSTDEYIDGVLVLNENLKAVNSKYKLLCLINENISEENIKYLEYFKIEYKKIDSIDYKTKFKCNNWLYTFDKLNIFSLIGYKKIVYLDSDLLILDNIDNLFDCKHLTMASNSPYSEHQYNSGIMIIEPKITDYNKLIELTKKYDEKKKKNIGDQNIINEYFKNINVLDDNYNQMRIIKEEIGNYYDISTDTYIPKNKVYITKRLSLNPKIIHYICLPKPFMLKGTFEDEYAPLYNKYLVEVRRKKNECKIKNTKLTVIIDSYNYYIDLEKCLNNLKNQTHKNIQILLLVKNTNIPSSKNVRVIKNNEELIKYAKGTPYITIITSNITLTNNCYELCLKYLVNYDLDWCQFTEKSNNKTYMFSQINFHSDILYSSIITKNLFDKVYKTDLLLSSSNLKQIIDKSNNVGIIGTKTYEKITY